MPCRARAWCFTAFNEEDPLYDESQGCTYLTWQRETCPETGRIHIQGYVEFRDAVTIRSAQRKLHLPGAHFAKRQGTPTQAAEYCQKEDTRLPGTDYKEEGERKADPRPGQRVDIMGLRDAVLNGKRGFDLLEDNLVCTFAKYQRFTNALTEMMQHRQGREWRQLKTTLLLGTGGTSKTKQALYEPSMSGGEEVWIRKPDSYRVPRSDNLKWFPNYHGEQTVIFDDFYGSSCKFERFLDLMDGHECALETKGGFGYACWTTVIITSNTHPDGWWRDHSYTEDPEFNRRIHEIIYVE